MNRDEAKARLAGYLAFLQTDGSYRLGPDWLGDDPVLSELPGGDWIAIHAQDEAHGVLMRVTGENLPFFGALGKVIPSTRWLPASREHFLGSAYQGRYQMYDKGLAVWEAFPIGDDSGHPIAKWEQIGKRARSCKALVAFFDLRGFTNWSASHSADEVQETVEQFENAFQNAFHKPWCQQVFAKGTGDGLMVVSEVGLYAIGGGANANDFQQNHAKAFCLACAETVSEARKQMPTELAVGCGLTIGVVTQLYVLGRFDYLGPCINDASKIQAIAYGELCISDAAVQALLTDGVHVAGKQIPGKGIRVDADALVTTIGRA